MVINQKNLPIKFDLRQQDRRTVPTATPSGPSIFSLFRQLQDWIDNPSNDWRIAIRGETKFHLRVANTPALRKQAFYLGRKIYKTASYTSNDESDLLCSQFDVNPDTLILLILDENCHPVGTCTLINDHPPTGLPVDETFQEEADLLRMCGKKLAEVVRLAIEPSVRGSLSREILIHLLNFSYIYAKHNLGCDGFLVTVNPKHVPYYERALGYKRVGIVKACPKVNNAPAALQYLCFAYASNRVLHEAGRPPCRDKKGALYPHLFTQEAEPFIASYLSRHLKPMQKQEALDLGLKP